MDSPLAPANVRPAGQSGVSRRNILAGVGAAIAAAGIAGFPKALYAQAEITVAEFLSLSAQLTGTKADELDEDVGTTLLGGFLATGNGDALTALVREEATFTSHTELANAIVAAWYSGVYSGADGPALATFTNALVWNALTFTKPFAECGGATGYWADPPES